MHTAAEWAEFHDFSALKAAAGERAGERSAYSLAAAPAWKVQATLQHVNPALLHSQLAPLPLDGKAEVHSQGAAIAFILFCLLMYRAIGWRDLAVDRWRNRPRRSHHAPQTAPA